MADMTEDEDGPDPALSESVDLTEAARPEALRAALTDRADELRTAADAHPGGHRLTSVRTASHQGHQIEVRTSYEITIDGDPLDAPINVENGGRVHYHGLPTRDFASTVDLVKAVIDHFPADPDLATQPGESGAGSHDDTDEHGHGHGHGHNEPGEVT